MKAATAELHDEIVKLVTANKSTDQKVKRLVNSKAEDTSTKTLASYEFEDLRGSCESIDKILEASASDSTKADAGEAFENTLVDKILLIAFQVLYTTVLLKINGVSRNWPSKN